MAISIKTAIAVLCLSAVCLAGCNQNNPENQQSNAAPDAPAAGGSAAPTQLPVAKDLSPESNQQFLADNAKRAGVMTLPSGLQYQVIKSGTGKSPTPNDLVTVTYRGQLINGMVFDETQPGKTATFPAGQLIPGWVEALQKMKEGDQWQLVIPANLGYGEAGAGGVIPPNQTLVFDMTLLKVEPPSGQPGGQ
ncbi:MAG: FKBP-type peptidyl-prolyl cis-trans isomerase [Alphaproteobacteria bacterium]|nr:FKBP-type peptidyl-prolyl cis-trans isomerase [Alphaproteobacteria bacterium]